MFTFLRMAKVKKMNVFSLRDISGRVLIINDLGFYWLGHLHIPDFCRPNGEIGVNTIQPSFF